MPHKSLEVSVEPKVLIWARKSIGRNIEEVAKRLKVSENTVASWELGQKKPTLVQLEKLAKTIYKRPLAAFFLPSPPAEPARLALRLRLQTLGRRDLPVAHDTIDRRRQREYG